MNRYVTVGGVVSAALVLLNPEIESWLPDGLPEISRWWTVVPVLALLIFGFLRALQERFEGLEEKLEERRKRKKAMDLLGGAYDKGKAVNKGQHSNPDKHDWVTETYDLIEDIFNQSRAQLFIDCEDYPRYDKAKLSHFLMQNAHLHIEAYLWQLRQLMKDADAIPLNPDFDPQGEVGGERGR